MRKALSVAFGIVLLTFAALCTFAALGLVLTAASGPKSDGTPICFAVTFAAFAIGGAIAGWRRVSPQSHSSTNSRIWPIAAEVIQRHVNALLAQKRIKSRTDPYGRVITDDWLREAEYFCRNILVPEIAARLGAHVLRREARKIARAQVLPGYRLIESQIEQLSNLALRNYVDQCVTHWERLHPTAVVEADAGKMSPRDYEQFCCRELCAIGWTARVQGGSGDQGVDIVAASGGTILVVQCKLYSGSVGNGAVQEINTGRLFHRAQMAAVVSNAPFTPGARAAAQQAGVLLLHHTQLRSLVPPHAASGASPGAPPV